MGRCVRAFLLLLSLSVVASSSAIAAASKSSEAQLLARIDSLATVEARAGLLSGVVLVARGDRVVFQHAYGFASWELRAPITAATRFGIGSITKPMTQLIVAMLAAEGRLDLDAPVSRYLGSFPVGPKGGQVTLRHLIDHRGGVPFRVTTEMDESRPLHPADVVARAQTKALLFEPGTQELYSSAGYTCVARVVELIEGKPFDVVLRDRIFRPASMTTASGETTPALMPQRALPHRLGASAGKVVVTSAPYKNLGFLTGAGSVYATAEDLLHFTRALRSGVFGPSGKALVSPSADATWRSSYGRTNGYEASFDVLPTEDVTFVFLTNLQSTSTWQLRERIRNVLSGRAIAAIPRPPAPLDSTFEPLDSVAGWYVDPADSIGDPSDAIEIAAVDGHLYRDDGEVYPIAGGRYYDPGSSIVMRFRRTSGGTVDGMLTVYPWANGEKLRLKSPGRP